MGYVLDKVIVTNLSTILGLSWIEQIEGILMMLNLSWKTVKFSQMMVNQASDLAFWI